MGKIKKLWKVLAGSVSWNLNTPENNSEVIKFGKKERRKDTYHGDIKGGFVE